MCRNRGLRQIETIELEFEAECGVDVIVLLDWDINHIIGCGQKPWRGSDGRTVL